MPFTERQIKRILLNDNGRTFIDPTRNMLLSTRVTESWLRRRLFAVEDQTVLDQHAMYKAALTDIRQRAFDLGEAFNVSKIDHSADGIAFRRSLLAFAEPRLRGLAMEVARRSFEQSVEMYLAGYFGRLWVLDMMTKPDVQVKVEVPLPSSVSMRALNPKLKEAFSADELAWELEGDEEREDYLNEILLLILLLRRNLTTQQVNEATITQVTRELRRLMGLTERDPLTTRGNFNAVQTQTRTKLLEAANRGTLDGYVLNVGTVQGVYFLTQLDARVCPVCERIAGGNPYLLNSSDFPDPPIHFNCRCSNVPFVSSELLIPPDEPPASRFDEWMERLGLTWILDKFLRGRKVDSSVA